MPASLQGSLVLRYGVAIVFLYFGFSQLIDSISWVGIIPLWAVELFNLPPAVLVLANGAFEVVCATLLIMGIWVRPIAYLLAAHLAVITVVMGLTPVGVRDFGLTMATLALGLLEGEKGNHG